VGRKECRLKGSEVRMWIEIDGYGIMFGLYLKSVGTSFEVTNPVNGGKLNDFKFIFLAFVA
jgi:hypothetical protein